MRNTFNCLVVLYLLVQPISTYAQDELNKAFIEAINFCRVNPIKFADSLLIPMLNYFDGTIYQSPSDEYPIQTKEGIKPLLELIEELKKMTPVGEFTYSKNLSKAALALALYQEKTGALGHSKVDGLSTHKRVLKYESKTKSSAECVAYGFEDPLKSLIDLLIDDGVYNRGHRIILLSPNFNAIGIARKKHRKYNWVTVANFGKL
ncbi:MAG: CAP domain-containing protein [Luteibaculaceae bacterium]